jgi:hypothetical protein
MFAGFLEGLGIGLYGISGAYKVVNSPVVCNLIEVSE